MADTDELISMLSEIIERYKPGGAFKKAGLAEYERGKTRSLAKQTQSLISAGLGGTTQPATLESKYEETVGRPFKLGLEEERIGALTKAMGAKAGYLEREATRQTGEEQFGEQMDLQKRQLEAQELASLRDYMARQQQISEQRRQSDIDFFGKTSAPVSGSGGGGSTGNDLFTHSGGSIFSSGLSGIGGVSPLISMYAPPSILSGAVYSGGGRIDEPGASLGQLGMTEGEYFGAGRGLSGEGLGGGGMGPVRPQARLQDVMGKMESWEQPRAGTPTGTVGGPGFVWSMVNDTWMKSMIPKSILSGSGYK